MSTRRLAVLTAVVIALFAFIVLFERHQPTTQERLERGDVLWDINEGKLARITIVRGAETLELVRDSDNSWRMARPTAYAADSSLLSSLVFDLARPQRLGEATEGVSGPDYGLTKPRVVVTVTEKEEKQKKPASHTLSLGSDVPGTDTVAARVQGENRIVFVRSTVAADLLKPVESFWSRRVFSGSSADVTKLSIARGRGQLEFEKRKSAWWMTRPVADLADATAVDRLVGDLLAANVTEFPKVLDSELSGDGLQPPIFTVSMTFTRKPQVLEIGATRGDGKTAYARTSGKILAIDSSITDELSREADAYRETKLVRFESGDVQTLAVTFGGKARTIVRSGPDWTESGKTVPATGVEDVLTAIAALTGKDFLSTQETAPAESQAEIANLKIEGKPGQSWAVSFRPFQDKRLAAKVTGRPAALAVEAADLDRVTDALKKISPQAPPAPKKKK